jgi:hypothetical protein
MLPRLTVEAPLLRRLTLSLLAIQRAQQKLRMVITSSYLLSEEASGHEWIDSTGYALLLVMSKTTDWRSLMDLTALWLNSYCDYTLARSFPWTWSQADCQSYMQLTHARSAERVCTFFEIRKISEDSRWKGWPQRPTK